MKFSELQDQLKENFGIDHLADIARELGVSPQAVSNWKSRDRVPYKYVLKLRKEIVIPAKELSDHHEKNTNESNQVFPENRYQLHHKEDTISLTDIILAMARQLKIIIITPSIICTIAIIYAIFYVSPVYESSAKFMSSSGGGSSSQATSIAATFGVSLPSGNSEPQWVYPEVIKSRTLARAMLKRKFDTKKYGPQKPLLQILTYGNRIPNIGLDTLIKDGVNQIIDMINITQIGSLYNLTIRAAEPVFARDFAIALLEELDAHQRKYNKTKTNEARQFIEERIINTEKELQDAEEALKNFSDRNRRIQNSPALLLEQQRLSREVSVLIGVFTTLKQQLETTKIEQVKESDYVVVLDPPEAPLVSSGPSKRSIVTLAGFMGIGLGIVFGFIREYVENSDQFDLEEMGKVKSLIMKNITDFIPSFIRNKFD